MHVSGFAVRSTDDVSTHILALAPTVARRSIEEVLLKAVADVGAKLGTRATKHAAGAVTSVGVVSLSVAAHDGLALLVSACALTAGTTQTVTAAVSVGSSEIGRAES